MTAILAVVLIWCGLCLAVIACIARNRHEQPEIGTDPWTDADDDAAWAAVLAVREALRADAIMCADFALWEIERQDA
jgi:hypothetical protein